MTKSDLKTGMRVTLRNGWIGTVCLGCEFSDANFITIHDIYVLSDGSYVEFMRINNDLTAIEFKGLDIIKVEIPNKPGSIVSQGSYTTIWTRLEPKLHTIAEIEKILGYKVKIVETKP